MQAGAGVVADSDPTYEYNETVNKAKGMLRAIGLAQTIEMRITACKSRRTDCATVPVTPTTSTDPSMLLVIDNYDSFTYNLVQYFGELGAGDEGGAQRRGERREIRTMEPSGSVSRPVPAPRTRRESAAT